MKKTIKMLLLALCLIVSLGFVRGSVFADTYSNNTLIYTQDNDNAKYFVNLEGVSQIAVNKSHIAYTLDGTSINVLNKKTKDIVNLQELYEISHTNIADIYLTKNYLVVENIVDASAHTLSAYDIHNKFAKVPIYINVAKTNELGAHLDYSVYEYSDKITIACITSNTFVAHTLSSKDLSYIGSYTNLAINSENAPLLNVATNDTECYIISEFSEDNSTNLYKLKYSENTQITKSYFPKENISDIVSYNFENTNYIIATDLSRSLYVIRDNLTFDAGKDNKDYADDTRTGNYAGTTFLANNFKYFNDIYTFNNEIYISDAGTKCIQQCNFELSNSKGSIRGVDVLVASECGEIGRFNRNANLSLSDNKIVVADNKNKRIQLIDDGAVISIDKSVLDKTLTHVIDDANLNNLATAVKIGNQLYFTTYNNENNNQNLYKLNLESNELKQLTHSVAKVYDMTYNDNYIFIASANGLHKLTLNDDTVTLIASHAYTPMARITCNNNNIFVADNSSLVAHDLNGATIVNVSIASSITDLTANDNIVYILSNTNKEILSYRFEETFQYVSKIAYNTKSDLYSITNDYLTGTIYAFDNNTCEIVKIINPTFNYKKDEGLYQVNNKNVCVYDRPYYLNGIDSPNVIKKLKVNTRVTIYSNTAIHYGNIEYYIIELDNNTYGYINKNDLTYTHNDTNYEIILPNASLRTFGNDPEINVYEEADKSGDIVARVMKGTRVFVSRYDSTSDFTFVRFYDADQNIIEGYVETDLVNPDDMTKPQMTALILIACSIVLIIAIAIIARVIYVKRVKKLKENQA